MPSEWASHGPVAKSGDEYVLETRLRPLLVESVGLAVDPTSGRSAGLRLVPGNALLPHEQTVEMQMPDGSTYTFPLSGLRYATAWLHAKAEQRAAGTNEVAYLQEAGEL